MSRLIFWTFLLTVAGGIVLHFKVSIPFLENWFGSLPGDMIITKGKVLIYLPIVSSFALALGITFLFSMLFRKT